MAGSTEGKSSLGEERSGEEPIEGAARLAFGDGSGPSIRAILAHANTQIATLIASAGRSGCADGLGKPIRQAHMGRQ